MLSRAEKELWNGAPVPLGYDFDEEIKFPVINEREAKKKKLERALKRLQDLYLFSDESMSEKDYLLRKQDIDEK
ncbi:hypothetical protein KQI42_06295 [Tissierella sp. MSJ-40]|uniref:Uncharacterized protein n=1 Tax=Tissierella simiarum TaxID=2841534 RepID=A0ABS6E3Y1_9FIRM|nr:hypothetical protein [Tissierella simiarum]MBU5437608.1 hypothetical protein [Tissierella simiarum]